MSMTHSAPHSLAHLLTRPTHQVRPALRFLGDLTLDLARVHEICGPARRTLTMQVMAHTTGPVFWISPAWLGDRLFAEGIVRMVDPARLIFVTPKRVEDLLWSMEECLRSGATPLVVADLPAPPGLTPVRRLHLAAETGAAEGRCRPLGLLLTPGAGGAQGVESRWHIAAQHLGEVEQWRLDRVRARTAPQKSWQMQRAPRGDLRLIEPAPLHAET
jgi:protein ImuA